MASFESWGWSKGPVKATTGEKHPLKRVEPALKKFITVLRIDLDRLQKHKQNIARLETLGEYDALDKEQVNARRTIQQLKANIRQLENTRSQVREEDLDKFDAKVRTLQVDAIVAVNEFLNSHDSAGSSPLRELSSNRIGPGHPKSFGYDPQDEQEISLKDVTQVQQEQLVVDQTLPSHESWDRLQEDLEDLNSIIHEFASVVEGQQEKVDEIENNVETAAENVREGTKSLIMANRWKAAAFPVAGALVGGLVGGPIGVMAGIKLGGLAAVGGGIAGFTGGRFLKNRQDKMTGMELQNLKDSRSKSLPEHLSAAASDDGSAQSTENGTDKETNVKRSAQNNIECAGTSQTENAHGSSEVGSIDSELDLIQVENS